MQYRPAIERYYHEFVVKSFPTRRSSDLMTSDSRIRETASWRRSSGTVRESLTYPSPLGPYALPGETDRKSTRLNSSHLVNSYAVVCLTTKRRTKSIGYIYAYHHTSR